MIDYNIPPEVSDFANKNNCSYVFFDNIRTPYKEYNVYDTTCSSRPRFIFFILENKNEITFAKDEDFEKLFLFDGNPFLLSE